ncbi:hypothetical protein [Actinocrispum sp. NPDC049592]|uniref:hypothetical protein n=1 Tax=Actinocrispum sp. NPDC049592 TaxID=3154835 RepID=UPI003445E930
MGEELFKSEDARRHGMWCDGFVPEVYDLDSPLPCVRGRAWIGYGPSKQDPYEFTLILPRGLRSKDDIDWAALMPADDMTGWLTYSREWKTLVIYPAAAVPG